MVMKAVNSQLLFGICCAFGVSVSVQGIRAENVRTALPPAATGSEAVRRIFEVKGIRPLEPASFEPLRKYFSTRQQRNIDEYLRVLDELTVTRNRVAQQAGIKENWWWPADVGTNVHIIMKNDPLTDRASTPDEVSISAPTLLHRNLRITVDDTYKEIAGDGTDLGGTKSSKVTLVPADGRWVVDKVVFTVRQYRTTTVTSLDEILARETKQLRLIRQKMENRKFEVRAARPVSKQ
jgi:hypothetical protein